MEKYLVLRSQVVEGGEKAPEDVKEMSCRALGRGERGIQTCENSSRNHVGAGETSLVAKQKTSLKTSWTG